MRIVAQSAAHGTTVCSCCPLRHQILNPGSLEHEHANDVNKDGKATAKLFNTPEGKPVLSFFHKEANVLNLGVASEGIADMIFYDRAGKPRIMMILAEDNASLGLYDPSRKSGIALSSEADGTSGLGLFFKDRKS